MSLEVKGHVRVYPGRKYALAKMAEVG